MSRQKIALISTSPFPYGSNITDGPGYRAWNLFQRISEKHDTVILSLYESFHRKLEEEFEVLEGRYLVKIINHRPQRVARAVSDEEPDVLYLPWSATPFISNVREQIPTIIDYVGSGLLEHLISLGYVPPYFLHLKLKSFWFGDFYMTAGMRERYYLLGLLMASRRLCAPNRRLGSSLIHFIPMTPPSTPPELGEKVIRKDAGEIIFLVAGAFLPWYGYPTLFHALDLLVKKGQTNFKCVFFGGNPRNPQFEKWVLRTGLDSRVKEKLIFTGAIPFKERGSYYLQSDLAINIPLLTVEDELSVRTRIMDYIWSSLPIVTPTTDEHSKMVLENGGGFQYSVNDPVSLATVLESLMDSRGLQEMAQAKKNMAQIYRNCLKIEDALEPLETFINAPFVDPTRKSPWQFLPGFVLWGRDALRWLKRGPI